MHITHNTVYVQFCTLYRMNLKYSFNTVCSEVIFTVGGGGAHWTGFCQEKRVWWTLAPFHVHRNSLIILHDYIPMSTPYSHP